MKKKDIVKVLKKHHLMPQAYRVDTLLNILHKETPGIQGSLFEYVTAEGMTPNETFIIDLVKNNQSYAIEQIKKTRAVQRILFV